MPLLLSKIKREMRKLMGVKRNKLRPKKVLVLNQKPIKLLICGRRGLLRRAKNFLCPKITMAVDQDSIQSSLNV